ncbi:MAG: YbhB/YbcL family Raf kinase inhibitor-like protein [Desulfobacterales bacterium]|nr:YbhB/YbcL family Raf kinase inhibitor-like protein [Desulfobacterales bacterium]
MAIKITSAAFEEGGMIPDKYTCDSVDISPHIEWTGIPDHTRYLALICDDPDAPMGTWVHWVLYDLPGGIKELSEKISPQETLENGAKHGTNDFGKFGYGGPCPPGGIHRYYFKIYALDEGTGLAPGATKAQLVEAMEGHILAQGQLMGRYKR